MVYLHYKIYYLFLLVYVLGINCACRILDHVYHKIQ